MTTLKDIREKNVKTDLELCILFMADPQTASDDDIQTADDALEELVQLRELISALRSELQKKGQTK
jgi:hypothetical protein